MSPVLISSACVHHCLKWSDSTCHLQLLQGGWELLAWRSPTQHLCTANNLPMPSDFMWVQTCVRLRVTSLPIVAMWHVC